MFRPWIRLSFDEYRRSDDNLGAEALRSMPGKLIVLAILLIVVMLTIWVLYGELIAARIARARDRAPDNDSQRGGDRWPGR
jgi:flagellar biosynthesis/type III secretory pathway M-ring protein FliF/YscJ